MRSLIVLASFTTVLAALEGAEAATLKVPQQHTSIQAAVNAAGAGDTILVKAGTYKENVSIAPGKEGLVLRGVGKVTIDARPNGASGSGAALAIGADGVRVENLLVRLALDGLSSSGVVVVANDVVFKNVKSWANEQAGFVIFGHRVRLERCHVQACELSGIAITGDDSIVDRCTVRQCDSAGISITGNNALVRKCVVHTIEDDSGIEIVGSDAHVIDNAVFDTDGAAIDVQGNDVVIRGNTVRSGPDADGILIDLATVGTIENNTCVECFQAGIRVGGDCSSILVAKNKVLRCGTESSHAIDIDGDQCTITGNTVFEAESDGIHVGGTGCVIQSNKVSRCFEDGIQINDVGATVSKNFVKDCVGEGIENSADGTNVTDNVMKGNRIDFVNDTTLGEFSGNVFATGGPMSLPEINT